MAKTKTKPAEVLPDGALPTDAARAVEARALVDLHEFGVLAGNLVASDAETIAGLVATGKADTHPGAVAYAKAQAAD